MLFFCLAYQVIIKLRFAECSYYVLNIQQFDIQTVAPRVGAWIETALMLNLPHPQAVAPHAGAWIETVSDSISLKLNKRGQRSQIEIQTGLLGNIIVK